MFNKYGIEQYTILDIPVFISNYILAGGFIIILSILVLLMLLKGKSNYKRILKEVKESGGQETNGYSIEKTKFKITTNIFLFVSRILDTIISNWITFIHKKTHKLSLKILDTVIPDSFLERVFGLKRNFNERIDFMNNEFPKHDNEFWHHKTRAPDFDDKSPIIYGRWFNGKKIERYLPFLISTRSFYIFVKSGVLVIALSFIVLSTIYHPSLMFGYQSESSINNAISSYEDKIKANPRLLPEYRKDVWSTAEFNKIKTDVANNANAYAISLIDTHNANEGFLVLNKYLTILFLSLAIGLAFIRYKYFNAFKMLKIKYIRDTHEDYRYEQNKSDVDVEKRNLASQNHRATTFDKDSPLIMWAEVSGSFEERGLLGAYRKGQKISFSTLDMSQNIIIYGATGSGKTREVITPCAESVFALKSKHLISEDKFNELYDTRKNILTDKAVKEGYLETYKPLPIPLNVISTAIMDIKSALKNDLLPVARKYYLGERFLMIGAKDWEGQLAIDLLKDLTPIKLIGYLSSMNSQMGGQDDGDFWTITALDWVKCFAYVAYCFNRTEEGIRFIQHRNIKPWSMSFLYELVCLDPNNELLAHCISAVARTVEEQPERIADIFTQDVVNSMQKLTNEWIFLDDAKETKIGVQANLSKIMSTYSSSALKPFLTGVGTSMCDVGDLWSKITAFDLNTDDYGMEGKLVLIFLKNLLFEEAVKRQIRFSNRLVEINNWFTNKYPELLVLETSPESIPQDFLDMTRVNSISYDAKLREDFIDLAIEIQSMINESWKTGSYIHNIKKIITDSKDLDSNDLDLDRKYSIETVELCIKSENIANELFTRNPRFQKQVGGMVLIDPNTFNQKTSDTVEVKELKKESMAMYYEFEELSTRIKREHFFFFGDEYQELITIDKTGVCYTDANFLNISRSTNFKLILATQTKSAFIAKVGKEIIDNFSTQFRSRIYLPLEDEATLEEIEQLAGETYSFINANKNVQLKNFDFVEDGYTIYNNLNSMISDSVYNNRKSNLKDDRYPYDFDVFSKAESIDIDFSKFDFNKPFSSIFYLENDFNIPTLKNHFLSIKNIGEYEQKGSGVTEIHDNKERIEHAYLSAKKEADNNYEKFLQEGYRDNIKIVPKSSVVSMGNSHAIVFIQRAGVTRLEHVILGS